MCRRQQRAAMAVNRELIALYWQIGRDILDRQAKAGWGAGILERISADLRAAFPEMRGFSRSNLLYMRAFADAWPDPAVIVQQPVGRLAWGSNLALLTRLKEPAPRLLYAARAVEHGWSRNVLTHHIEPEEFRFTLTSRWSQQLFVALARRYKLKPFRKARAGG